MTKLLLYAFLAYIIYLVVRFLNGPVKRRETKRPPKQLSGTMVKDETCNTYLPKEEALRDIIDGKEMYFCSKECRKKYVESKKSGA